MAKKDWTERSDADFIFSIAADFMDQIQQKMEDEGISQEQLADMLGVTAGRVSQLLHDPGNLTLQLTVKCARVLGLKASLFAYDDYDPTNELGAIAGEMFLRCWKRCGMPRNAWQLEEPTVTGSVLSEVIATMEINELLHPPTLQNEGLFQKVYVLEARAMTRPDVNYGIAGIAKSEEYITCRT